MLYQNDGDVNPSSSIPPAQSSSIYDTGFKDKIGEVKNRITNIGETLKELELGAERVSETFGFAGDKVRNMEISIGKSATGLLEVSKNAMTYEAALKRASEIVVEVSNATKRSFVASAEVIKGLETTSQATGVSTKDLAANFSEVGFQLTDVQDQMKTAIRSFGS